MTDQTTFNNDWIIPLSDEEKKTFDKDGYLILKNLLTPEQLANVRHHLDAKISQGETKEGKEMNEKMHASFKSYIEVLDKYHEAGKITEAELNKLKMGKAFGHTVDTSRFEWEELEEIGNFGGAMAMDIVAGFKSGLPMDAPIDDGAVRVANMANVSSDLAVLYTHPRVLGAAHHLFGEDFKINEVSSRSSGPGKGAQALHYDVNDAHEMGKKQRGVDKSDLVFAMWAVDDFDEENGATRVVPGSHVWKDSPEDVLDEKEMMAPYPGQKQAVMPAGSVLLFQSYIWHSGVKNTSTRNRRMFYNSFGERQYPALQDMKEFLSDERKAELTDVERYVFEL